MMDNPRRNKSIYMVFLALVILALLTTGCSDNIERAVSSESLGQPYGLLRAYAGISGAVCLMLVLFANRPMWQALIETILYMGAVTLVTAPLMVREVGEPGTIAMGISGFLGVIVSLAIRVATSSKYVSRNAAASASTTPQKKEPPHDAPTSRS